MTFASKISTIELMQLRKSTIEKFGDILIRLGEASVIGGTVTFFVKDFPIWQSLFAFFGGVLLMTVGLYVNNIADAKGV